MPETEPALTMFTVYKNPSDFPPGYALRKWSITERGPIAEEGRGGVWSLDEIRAMIPPGLHRMDRMPEDEPCIVEVWI